MTKNRCFHEISILCDNQVWYIPKKCMDSFMNPDQSYFHTNYSAMNKNQYFHEISIFCFNHTNSGPEFCYYRKINRSRCTYGRQMLLPLFLHPITIHLSLPLIVHPLYRVFHKKWLNSRLQPFPLWLIFFQAVFGKRRFGPLTFRLPNG